MTTKVKVTQEVSDALDRLLRGIDGTRFNKYGIIASLEDPEEQARFPEFRVLSDYYYNGTEWDSPRHPHSLMQALVNGYEVEKTPEELRAIAHGKVRDYYSELRCNEELSRRRRDYDDVYKYMYKRHATSEVLSRLGINIPGVNA